MTVGTQSVGTRLFFRAPFLSTSLADRWLDYQREYVTLQPCSTGSYVTT